jgi:hypothetical protein
LSLRCNTRDARVLHSESVVRSPTRSLRLERAQNSDGRVEHAEHITSQSGASGSRLTMKAAGNDQGTFFVRLNQEMLK